MPLCTCRCLLTTVDIFISCFVILPLVALYWSGAWKLCDIYILPEQPTYSACISLATGSFIGLLGYFVLPILKEIVPADCSLKHAVVSRTFLCVYAFGMLNYWRGIWHLLDRLLGDSVVIAAVALLVAELALLAVRASTNMLSSPFIVLLDTRRNFYETYPRFRQQVGRLCCYSLDSLFTFFVILTLVIQAWVGLWNLLDLFLLPGNTKLSYYVCLGVGLPTAVVFLSLQWPMQVATRSLYRRSPLGALLFGDVLKLAATVITLLIWRGTWGFMKDYIIVHSTWKAWCFHTIGITGLLLTQSLSTLVTVGCAVDAEQGDEGDGLPAVRYTLAWWQHYHPEPASRSHHIQVRKFNDGSCI